MLHLRLWFPAAAGGRLCPRPFRLCPRPFPPWLLSGLIWSGSSSKQLLQPHRTLLRQSPPFAHHSTQIHRPQRAESLPCRFLALLVKRILKIASEGNWRTIYWSQRAKEQQAKQQGDARSCRAERLWKEGEIDTRSPRGDN